MKKSFVLFLLIVSGANFSSHLSDFPSLKEAYPEVYQQYSQQMKTFDEMDEPIELPSLEQMKSFFPFYYCNCIEHLFYADASPITHRQAQGKITVFMMMYQGVIDNGNISRKQLFRSLSEVENLVKNFIYKNHPNILSKESK